MFGKYSLYILLMLVNNYYYTLTSFVLLCIKVTKTIGMFYGKFADEGDNLVDNTNMYIM